ncbi:MAG: uracil-DNA glycosylase family protein [Halobacteriales archaeon]
MGDPDVHACTRCPALVECRTQIVNGRGAVDAALVLVGEAPGREEDAAGRPFVGRSGRLLEAALRERGVEPSAVRITNLVRCRPPDNRDPYVAERRHCRVHLEHELAVVDPEVVLTMGRIPTQELLDGSTKVTEAVGSTASTTLGGSVRTVVVGLHPAATLYDRSRTADFEAALERALDLADLV